MDDPSRPVQRFQVSTQDEGETEQFIRDLYVSNQLTFLGVRDDARFTARAADGGGVVASRLRSTVDYRSVAEPFDHFMSFALTHGRLEFRSRPGGRDETIVPAGDVGFYPIGRPLEIDLYDMGARTLQLPLARLAQTAAHLTGERPDRFAFHSTRPLSPALARQWTALMELTADTLLTEDSAAANSLVGEELTRMASMLALYTFPNTALATPYRHGPGWVAPDAVRRAASFLHAHAGEPLTLQQVARASGVGARALQYAFRRHFDVSPMEYLRAIRLDRADEELRAADPAGPVTVAEVARRWGWAGLNHFTAAYRRRFGVLPSRTLRS